MQNSSGKKISNVNLSTDATITDNFLDLMHQFILKMIQIIVWFYLLNVKVILHGFQEWVN